MAAIDLSAIRRSDRGHGPLLQGNIPK